MTVDPVDDRSRWLNLTEVGQEIGVSRRVVRRMIDDGQLPASRIGRRTLISRAAVVEYQNRLAAQAGEAS